MTHTTYLHCAPKPGWPADHTTEDAFDLPKKPRVTAHEARAAFYNEPESPQSAAPLTPAIFEAAEEYRAEYTSGGGVVLVLSKTQQQKTTIAYFDTYVDAQTAAKALNELKGY